MVLREVLEQVESEYKEGIVVELLVDMRREIERIETLWQHLYV